LKEYLDVSFLNWQDLLLRHVHSNKKLSEIIAKCDKASADSRVFYETENKVKEFDSVDELKEKLFMKARPRLQGCFEKDGLIGLIELRSFALKVKSINNPTFGLRKEAQFTFWKKLLKFVDRSEKHIIDKATKYLLKH